MGMSISTILIDVAACRQRTTPVTGGHPRCCISMLATPSWRHAPVTAPPARRELQRLQQFMVCTRELTVCTCELAVCASELCEASTIDACLCYSLLQIRFKRCSIFSRTQGGSVRGRCTCHRAFELLL
jgi:hypothetical protein